MQSSRSEWRIKCSWATFPVLEPDIDDAMFFHAGHHRRGKPVLQRRVGRRWRKQPWTSEGKHPSGIMGEQAAGVWLQRMLDAVWDKASKGLMVA